MSECNDIYEADDISYIDACSRESISNDCINTRITKANKTSQTAEAPEEVKVAN